MSCLHSRASSIRDRGLLQTLVLTKWLAVNDKNMLPPYAHTTLGVGAFVVNEKEEALVILEKFSHAPDFWKLPGGAVDVDEELTAAAEREVKVCVFCLPMVFSAYNGKACISQSPYALYSLCCNTRRRRV